MWGQSPYLTWDLSRLINVTLPLMSGIQIILLYEHTFSFHLSIFEIVSYSFEWLKHPKNQSSLLWIFFSYGKDIKKYYQLYHCFQLGTITVPKLSQERKHSQKLQRCVFLFTFYFSTYLLTQIVPIKIFVTVSPNCKVDLTSMIFKITRCYLPNNI